MQPNQRKSSKASEPVNAKVHHHVITRRPGREPCRGENQFSNVENTTGGSEMALCAPKQTFIDLSHLGRKQPIWNYVIINFSSTLKLIFKKMK